MRCKFKEIQRALSKLRRNLKKNPTTSPDSTRKKIFHDGDAGGGKNIQNK